MATKAIIFARVSSVQQEYERQISDLMPVVEADGYIKDEIHIIKYNKRWQSIQDEIDRTLKIKNDNMDNIVKFKAMSEQFQDRLDTHKIIGDESFKALTDPVEIKALVQKCIRRIDVSQLSANSYKIQVHYTDPSLDDNEVWYHYSVRGWKLELKYVCGEIVREMEWERRI